MNFVDFTGFAWILGLVGLGIAGAIYGYVKRQDPGNETMIDLGEQIGHRSTEPAEFGGVVLGGQRSDDQPVMLDARWLPLPMLRRGRRGVASVAGQAAREPAGRPG